jgi:hypothetical protein
MKIDTRNGTVIDITPEELRRLPLDTDFNKVAEYFGGETKKSGDVKELARKISDGITKTFDKPAPTRAEIVAKAKRDVAELLSRNYPAVCGYDSDVWFDSEGGTYHVAHKCEFVVNREKRTVVALIKNVYSDDIKLRGVTHCAPDDVFNADIGKAIALPRALGLTVPREYTNAPKPEGVRVGDVVVYSGNSRGKLGVVRDRDYSDGKYSLNGYTALSTAKGSGTTIIDDTDREEYANL